MNTLEEAIQNAKEADEAYQAELERLYGDDAWEARLDHIKGREGPELYPLWRAHEYAQMQLFNAYAERDKEQGPD